MNNKTRTEDFYSCTSCDISSATKDRMCPCPRGGCDAEIVGKTITTTETILFKKKTKSK